MCFAAALQPSHCGDNSLFVQSPAFGGTPLLPIVKSVRMCPSSRLQGWALGWVSAFALLASHTTFGQTSFMDNCSYLYNVDGVKATFDLSSLTNTYGSYAINDQYQSDDKESYSYFFNVCHNVSSATVPDGDLCTVDTAASYQVVADEQCIVAGTLSEGSFMLLSDYLGLPLDPSMGVVLSYAGGLPCAGVQPRTTDIIIECSNDETKPDDQEMSEAQQKCTYALTLPSKVGCPLECPVGGSERLLCSGKGVCGYDTPQKEVR